MRTDFDIWHLPKCRKEKKRTEARSEEWLENSSCLLGYHAKYLNHYYDCQWKPKCNLWTLLLPASFAIFLTFLNSYCCRNLKIGLIFWKRNYSARLFFFSPSSSSRWKKPPFDILCLYCAVVHGAYGPLNLLCAMHNAQSTMTSITPSIYPRAVSFVTFRASENFSNGFCYAEWGTDGLMI